MGQYLYTVTEAAELLKLHPKTLRKKIRSGELQSTRVGKQYRITQSQLEEYCGASLDSTNAVSQFIRREALVSTVFDIHAISPEDSSRITNYLLATQKNSRDEDTKSKLRIDCIYYQEIGNLKILLNGDSETIRHAMKLVETLMSS
ncbi:MAG: hypothetical protein COA96_03090 [SAR86 cluster bacterium]|uniref:Helix-turn-helix domain-containing protein n=1 Tax=SAR86 cluster bacterium TaxID=2030880 RepID=A0A2A5B7J0_9GAMM|nr:MAG: hypothetical protein COA96_03090 [SAR86 cluster bacterium]